MRRAAHLFCFAIPLAFEVVTASTAHAAPNPVEKPGWELTFQDEFEGDALDTTKWRRRYKWGQARVNNELQAYVDDAFVVKDGVLRIVASQRKATYAGDEYDYASGVIASVHSQKFGYLEAHLKTLKGKGLWPAFWTLAEGNVAGVHEIDIMEYLGHQPTTMHMTVHWGTQYGVDQKSDTKEFSNGAPDFSADFHTFAVEWDADKIIWYVDNVEHHRHTGPGVPQVAMYMIANLAVGGNWPGSPDASTTFPAEYQIDYIRAYQKADQVEGSGGSAGAPNGTGGSTPTAGSGGTKVEGTGGTAGKGGTNTSTSGGAEPNDSDPPEDDSSGCSCRVASGAAAEPGIVATLALALGLMLRRRRR